MEEPQLCLSTPSRNPCPARPRFTLQIYKRDYTNPNLAAVARQIESDMNKTSTPHSSRCKGGDVFMHKKPE